MAQRNNKPSMEETKSENNSAVNNEASTTGGTSDNAKTTSTSPFYKKSNTEGFGEFLKVASNISTGVRAGTKLSFNSPGYNNITDANFGDPINDREFRVPGITVYEWVPTFGVANSLTDPLNTAATAMFNEIRKNITGNRTWDRADLWVYTACVSSLYCAYANGVRILGLLNKFTPWNIYRPQALFAALGYDYEAWVNGIPNFVTQMMNIRNTLKKYIIPPNLNIFLQQLDLNSFVFQDGSSDVAQLYAFQQSHYYSYEYVDQAKGIKLIPLHRHQRTYNDYIKFPNVYECSNDLSMGRDYVTPDDYIMLMRRMLAALGNSDDVSRINADIAHTYGENAMTIDMLPDIAVDVETAIVELPDHLKAAISNARIVGINPASCKVYDSRAGYFISEPGYTLIDYDDSDGTLIWGEGYPAYGNLEFIDTHDANPDPQRVVDMMRFVPWIDMSSFNKANVDIALEAVRSNEAEGGSPTVHVPLVPSYVFSSVGTEVIHSCRVISLADLGTYQGSTVFGSSSRAVDYAEDTIWRIMDIGTYTPLKQAFLHHDTTLGLYSVTTVSASSTGLLETIGSIMAYKWKAPLVVGGGNSEYAGTSFSESDPALSENIGSVPAGVQKLYLTTTPLMDAKHLVPIDGKVVYDIHLGTLLVLMFGS